MSVDVVVIGGGIIGCTAAYYLAKKGRSIAIVEKHSIAGGTTARNFSWINASTKTSDADYHHLNALGVRMYADLAEKYGPASLGLGGTGAIGIARRSEAATYVAMQNQARTLKELGYPVEWLDLPALRALEPDITFSGDTEGLLTPSDKSLDAPMFSRFMIDQVRQMGGQVMEHCSALEIVVDDDGNATGLVTDQGLIKTSGILLAVGPDTPEVLGRLTGYDGFATRFPVRKVPGLLVSTPRVEEGLVRHLLYTDIGGEFHIFPEQGGGLRLASDDVDGQVIEDHSPEHIRDLAEGLLRRMKSMAPKFAGIDCLDSCSLSVGVRAYPDDGKSIAGALPGAGGVFMIATHSGITLAPALGSLIAELIVDGVVPRMLRPFGLERLPGF